MIIRFGNHDFEITKSVNYIGYLNSTDTKLEDVYGRCSYAKKYAFAQCEKLFADLNGYALRIVSHNTFLFTVGFIFPEPETGELYFAFVTREHLRAYPLSELDHALRR